MFDSSLNAEDEIAGTVKLKKGDSAQDILWYEYDKSFFFR